MVDFISDIVEDTNWVIVGAFWLPISAMILKFYSKSELMGTWQNKTLAIVGMFIMITIIVKAMDR